MVITSIFSIIIELIIIVSLIIAFLNGYSWYVFVFLIPFLVLFVLLRKTIVFSKKALIYNFKRIPFKDIAIIEIDRTKPTRGVIFLDPLEVNIYFNKKKKVLYLGLFISTKKMEQILRDACAQKCIKFIVKTN